MEIKAGTVSFTLEAPGMAATPLGTCSVQDLCDAIDARQRTSLGSLDLVPAGCFLQFEPPNCPGIGHRVLASAVRRVVSSALRSAAK
jgi:hypothetical protein